MTVEELQNIKDLIKKAELSTAKAQGKIEGILAEWKKEYNISKVEDAEKKLNELKIRENNLGVKVSELYRKLLDSQDWEKLEKELK